MNSKVPDPLDIERVKDTLKESTIGHTIVYLQSVESTMSIAHELANRPSTRSGTLIVAEEQSAGRGRLDRTWHAPKGSSLLCSLLLKGEQLPKQPTMLMMMAGVAIVNSLALLVPTLSGHCGLKWPNDVLLGREKKAAKKVSGILIENQLQGAHLSHAVIGFGINVNQTAQELPRVASGALLPTSLFTFTGEHLNRSVLLIELARQWEQLLQQDQNAENAVYEQWRTAQWMLGEKVVVREGDAVLYSGTALNVETDGSLLLADEIGAIHTIHAGDVSLRAA